MKTSFLFFVVSLQKLSWFMSLSDYICLINASLFDGGVCALVFFSLWESTFCIVRLRSVCRLHVHVSYVSDVLRERS